MTERLYSRLICAALGAVTMLLGARGASAVPFEGPTPPGGEGITFEAASLVVAQGPPAPDPYGPFLELQRIHALVGGYKDLGPPISTLSTPGGGIAARTAPLPSLSAAQPAVPDAGFGGGAARIVSDTFAFGNGAEVSWRPQTFVADGGPGTKPPALPPSASVNFSRGTATFLDPGGTFDAIPYVSLFVEGTLGNPGNGAFLAASLAAHFTVLDALGAPLDSFFASVAVVSDGTGPEGDFVVFTEDRPSTPTIFPETTGLGTNHFLAGGINELFPIIIPPEGKVTIDGTLSLIADPGNEIKLATSGECRPSLPNFGAVACLPIIEPANAWLFGIGAGFTVALSAIRRRRAVQPS